MAVDFFLKIDGIKGESQDSKHKGEIQIESWSWGETQAGSHSGGAGGGGGAGKVAMQDFHFTMHTNNASPDLLLWCAQGAHVKSALLTCRKAGKEQQEYLKISFDDLLISSYQIGGSGGSAAGVLPIDQVSFNFAQIKIEYAPQNEKGGLGTPVVRKYNVKTNTGG